MYTIEHIYQDYILTEDFIDKKIFKDICSVFNIEIISYILEGLTFNMGNNLSTISVVRKERDFRSPTIDWGESNKYKKELLNEGEKLYNSETDTGVKWHIYYTDRFYCK